MIFGENPFCARRKHHAKRSTCHEVTAGSPPGRKPPQPQPPPRVHPNTPPAIPHPTRHHNPPPPRSPTILSLRRFLALPTALLAVSSLHADPVPIRFPQGSAHVFLTLSTLDGKRLAAGDFSQTETHDHLNARLVFRFRDGSIDDETTTYTQRGTFHLLRDHHLQKGPSFPHPIDMLIDVPTGQVTTKTPGSNGKPIINQQHLDLPPDLSNGLALPLLMNIRPATPVTKLALLVPGEKARMVHLAITPAGDDTFYVAGSRRKATHYIAHIEIGGLAGIVAPILGKAPDDIAVWIYQGDSPTFVKMEGQFYQGGPLWRAEITAATWPK